MSASVGSPNVHLERRTRSPSEFGSMSEDINSEERQFYRRETGGALLAASLNARALVAIGVDRIVTISLDGKITDHTWKVNERRSGMDPEIREAIMGHWFR